MAKKAVRLSYLLVGCARSVGKCTPFPNGQQMAPTACSVDGVGLGVLSIGTSPCHAQGKLCQCLQP